MPKSIYKTIVLKLLGNMKLGRLKLSIANTNEQFEFGGDEQILADIQVNDEAFFKQIVLHGDIGFGEAYMSNLWETSNLTDLVSFMILNINSLPGMSGSQKAFNPVNWLRLGDKLIQSLKPNSLKGARKNISAHYDLSNDFFSLWLDPSMTYSSALFKDGNESLEQAQHQKYDSLCQNIKLTDKDHLLEIGCGWGGFSIFAAKNFGCKVTGITISEEQYKFATERIKKEKLDDKIEILFKDYRLVEGSFDKIVSIEMIEAVGHKYFKAYFRKINDLLKPNGVLGLQAIIVPDLRYDQYRKGADWIRKHIFPGGLLPSIAKINETINEVGNLNLYGLKDMGISYSKTLKSWYENFHDQLPAIKRLGFDDTFVRKWDFYLCSCEASFKQRNINVVQMVYARPNNSLF